MFIFNEEFNGGNMETFLNYLKWAEDVE